MNKVTSQFTLRTYLEILFFLAFLSFPIYLLFRPEVFSKSVSDEKKLLVALVMLTIYFILFYTRFKKASVVRVDSEAISVRGLFANRRVSRSDIRSIDLFSKMYWWGWRERTVGIKMELENGKKIFIVDPFYKNIGEIKTSLVQHFGEKIKPTKFSAIATTNQAEIESEYEIIAGNPHTSINGIMLYAFTSMFILVMIVQQYPFGLRYLILLAAIAIFYFILGYQLHYFLISNKHFVVRNHFMPWIHETYDVADIIEMNREQRYRRSDLLRITTRDFKMRFYPAGSLRKKHWKRLREKVEGLKIEFVEVDPFLPAYS
jgi:hypothetical protein